MSCEVKFATLCLKNIGGSGEEMDAVYSSDRTKSVVLRHSLDQGKVNKKTIRLSKSNSPLYSQNFMPNNMYLWAAEEVERNQTHYTHKHYFPWKS
jgi:hypothetical protein